MAEGHESFMRLALEEAERAGQAGNRAVGAVIVREGVALGRGGNRRESTNDPTGHAETTAMRDAVANTGALDFAGCTLYTTLEPCPMCCGAILANNIPAVVVGGLHTLGERRWGDYTVHKLLDLVDQGTTIETGVLADQCNALLHDWDVRQGRVQRPPHTIK